MIWPIEIKPNSHVLNVTGFKSTLKEKTFRLNQKENPYVTDCKNWLQLLLPSAMTLQCDVIDHLIKNWILFLHLSGEGKGCPLQYSGLENSMGYIVHGVAKSRTGLRDFHFTSLSLSLSCCKLL